MAKKLGLALLFAVFAACGPAANGAELKVLSAGAFMQVIEALIPDFEKATGHKVKVEKDTANPQGAALLKAKGMQPAS